MRNKRRRTQSDIDRIRAEVAEAMAQPPSEPAPPSGIGFAPAAEQSVRLPARVTAIDGMTEPVQAAWARWPCQVGEACPNPPAYFVRYRVVGKPGRRSFKLACKEHAERAAAERGIEITRV